MSDFLFGHALARTRGRLVAPFYFGIGNPQLGGHDAAALHQRELARLDVKEEICPCDHNAGHAGKVSFHILCRDEVGVEVLHQDGPLRDSENVVADLGLEVWSFNEGAARAFKAAGLRVHASTMLGEV